MNRSAAGATAVRRRRPAIPIGSEAGNREQENEKATESPATMLHRERPAAAPHRVVVSLNPLAPDTGLRHRSVREIAGRADEAPGRDDKDVGVRSFSCGVARKEDSALACPAVAERTHAMYPDRTYLFVAARPLGCTRTGMVVPTVLIVQQGVISATLAVLYGRDATR